MELPSPPRCIAWRRPRAALAGLWSDAIAFHKLSIDVINVTDNEPVGRTVGWVRPLIRVCPLDMQLHAVSLHYGIPGCNRFVQAQQGESKTTVKLNCRRYIVRCQDWMNAMKNRLHLAP